MSVPWYLMAKGKGGGYKTASGPIVSISDALAAPLRSLRVGIDPVQDLHGYDSPWPAGGGKNKLNDTLRSFGGSNIYFGGASGNIGTPSLTLPSGTYTFSVTTADGTSTNLYARDALTGQAIGSPAYSKYALTFTLTETTGVVVHVYKDGYTSVNDIVHAQVELGSTATTYAPYSNECPISGWDEANLWRTGKNLAKLSSENAGDNQRSTVSYTDSGAVVTATGVYGRYGWLIPVKAGNTYTITYNAVVSDEGNNNKLYYGSKDAVWYTTADGYIGQRTATTTETHYTDTITVPSDTLFIGLYVSALGTSGSMTISDLQVELSSTPTPYAPYTGNQFTIQLGQTVYGGTLDVLSGVLTVDRVADTFTKDSVWYGFSTGAGNASAVVQLSQYQNCKFVDGSASYNGAISSTGKEAANYWVSARQSEVPNEGDMCFAYSQSGQLRFHRLDVSNITDLESFKAAFPDTVVCYELATPITIPLTPQEISTLAGQNVVWADCGDVTVEYLSAGGANPDLMKLAVAFMGEK